MIKLILLGMVLQSNVCFAEVSAKDTLKSNDYLLLEEKILSKIKKFKKAHTDSRCFCQIGCIGEGDSYHYTSNFDVACGEINDREVTAILKKNITEYLDNHDANSISYIKEKANILCYEAKFGKK